MTERMPNVGERIATHSRELRKLLAEKQTESVVGWCVGYAHQRAFDVDDLSGLHSRYRQLAFLLGLLLSTPEPNAGSQVEEAEWKRILTDLNTLYDAYGDLFLPASVDEANAPSSEWRRAREVAMPAFLHHFFSGLLASAEQIRTRILRYIVPFDAELRGSWGMTATEALNVADWIVIHLQQRIERASQLAKVEREAREALLHVPASSIEEIRSRAKANGYLATAEALIHAVHRMHRLERNDLVAEFGIVGDSYWGRFSVGRGEGGELTYPTESSSAEIRPLIRGSEGEAICVSANSLYLGILRAAEITLLAGPSRARFLSTRDSVLEQETSSQVRRLVGSDAAIFEGVAEEPNGQHEHDLVVVAGNAAFIVEAKASPPAEPFRDPDKAFQRLRRAFRSDKGIQKGFEQGARIRRRLDAGEHVELFNSDGTSAVTLSPGNLSSWYCVCVTRDDYGPLATDLALLLEKKTEEPYPWVVNILDLEALGDAWEHLGWGVADLIRYITERTTLHGRVFSTDELDFAGAFIRHDGLERVDEGDDAFVVLDPRYSNFFDELYAHVHHGGPPPRRDVGKPFISDLRASLAAGVPVPPQPSRSEEVVGAGRGAVDSNPWCTCGSGFRQSVCACGARKR